MGAQIKGDIAHIHQKWDEGRQYNHTTMPPKKRLCPPKIQEEVHVTGDDQKVKNNGMNSIPRAWVDIQ